MKIAICNAEKNIICNCYRPATRRERIKYRHIIDGRGIYGLDLCDPECDHSHGGKTAETCQYREELPE